MVDRRDTTARTALIAAIVLCTALTALAFAGLIAEVRRPGATALPLAATSIEGILDVEPPPTGLDQDPPSRRAVAPEHSIEPTGAAVVADAYDTPGLTDARRSSLLTYPRSEPRGGSTTGWAKAGATDATAPRATTPTTGSAPTVSTARLIRHPSTTTTSHTTTGRTTTTTRVASSPTTEQTETTQTRVHVTTTLRDSHYAAAATPNGYDGPDADADDEARGDDERPEREIIRPPLRDDRRSESYDD